MNMHSHADCCCLLITFADSFDPDQDRQNECRFFSLFLQIKVSLKRLKEVDLSRQLAELTEAFMIDL